MARYLPVKRFIGGLLHSPNTACAFPSLNSFDALCGLSLESGRTMSALQKWRLGVGQMRVVPGDQDGNLRRAEQAAETASAMGCRLLILPEALDCGWTDTSCREVAGPIPGGRSCEWLRDCARKSGLHLAAGIVERHGEGLFNAAILIAPEGEILLHHRKIHELDFARKLYRTGDRLQVADTSLGRIGLMICADAFAPGLALSRALAQMEAKLIVSPCAWAVPPNFDPATTRYGAIWEESYGTVCRESGIWIAGVSHVGSIREGTWAGHRCIGNSMVVSPDGMVRHRGTHGMDAEEVCAVEVEIPVGSRI